MRTRRVTPFQLISCVSETENHVGFVVGKVKTDDSAIYYRSRAGLIRRTSTKGHQTRGLNQDPTMRAAVVVALLLCLWATASASLVKVTAFAEPPALALRAARLSGAGAADLGASSDGGELEHLERLRCGPGGAHRRAGRSLSGRRKLSRTVERE